MTATVFVDARIFDGNKVLSGPGQVRVEGDKIVAVARAGEGALSLESARVVDCQGGALMPGLIDIHTHLGLGSTVERTVRPGDFPDAEMALMMAHCGRVMLDHGYTSGYSGGSASVRAELAAAEAFASGALPGPRLRTSSFERVPGGPMGLAVKFPGANSRAPDPKEVVAFVDEMADRGVYAVKFLLNGVSAFDLGTNFGEQFYDEEILAAGEAAQRRGVRLTAHCYTSHATRLALKAGFSLLYHLSYVDDATLDVIAAHPTPVFIGPAPGIVESGLIEAPQFGIMADAAGVAEQEGEVAGIKAIGRKLRERGIRSLPGGDYGFPWLPIGKNARDLELFVEWFGYTPTETLAAATSLASQTMGMVDSIGHIRAGYLADLLLIDGDPTERISLLRDKNNILAVMIGGRFHKAPRASFSSPTAYRTVAAPELVPGFLRTTDALEKAIDCAG